MPLALEAFLLSIVAFQIWVTVRLWRIEWFEKAEKIAQSKLIWLLPLLGAAMVYSVIADEDEPQGPASHLRS
jgi:hypothetical protein